MRAVIIDDEYPAISELTYLLEKHNADVIGSFTSPEAGYEFLLKERPEVVFLDIDMPQYSGLELGAIIRRNIPATAIVYVTAYPQYAMDSFKVYPVDYMLKPIDEVRFGETVGHLKENAEALEAARSSSLKIKCFGKFKVLSQDEEIRFTTQKTRELLAYLICNNNQIIYRDELTRDVFDSGDEKKDLNNLRVSLHRLRSAFMEKGISKDELLIKNDYSMRVKDDVCDLMDLHKFIHENAIIVRQNIGEAVRIANMIHGDFMSDIDTPWMTENRERILLQAEDLLMKIGLYYIDNEPKKTKAEEYFSRIIENNPLSEPGYMALLDLYMHSGNIAKFTYTYKTYSKLLQEEFDCAPDKRFTVFYRQHAGI